MADAQAVYDEYVKNFGFAPQQPGHLLAYAKKSGAKLKFSEARQVIAENANDDESFNASSPNSPPSKSISDKFNTSPIPTQAKTTTFDSIIKTSSASKSNVTTSKPVPTTPISKSNASSSKPTATMTVKPSSPNSNTAKPPGQPSVTMNANSVTISTSKQPLSPSVNSENPDNDDNPNNSKIKTNATEQARMEAIQRLSSSNNKFAAKAKQYNKSVEPPKTPKTPKTPKPSPVTPTSISIPTSTSDISTTTELPPFPCSSNDDQKEEGVLTPSQRGRPSDAKFPPPPPRNPASPSSKPKIPGQPTVIAEEKAERTEPLYPPSSSSRDEEKTAGPVPKGDANNIIVIRVNYECKSEKGKQDIYEALRAFVKLQIDKPYPGTITYHFTCPNPVKHPLKLEFFEVYYNEDVFWEHSKSQSFAKYYFKAFAGDKYMKSKTFVTLGPNLSSKMKQTVKGIGSTFPMSDAGYLFHEECLKALDYADDTKLMLKFHMIAPKYSQSDTKNVELIFDIMGRMSVYAKESYAVMFNAHRLDQKEYPDHLELISIWPNIQCLIEFLQNEKVQVIIYEFKELMISQTDKMNRKNYFLCELYSEIEIKEEVMTMIKIVFDDIGYTQQLKTDIGYILHPKANSSQLK